MTDEGAQRRDARQFEPPPWEREQFDDFQRKRAEQERAEQSAEPQVAEREAEPETAPETVAPVDAELQPEKPIEGAEPKIDQARIDAMMFELRAEEPPASRSANQARVAVAVFMLFVGTVLMLWGMVAFVKVMRTPSVQKGLAVLLSGALLVFGIGFIIMGGWLANKVYQQRGVR